jgi:hypothetical protein
MPYSDFTLEKVKRDFEISTIEANRFAQIQNAKFIQNFELSRSHHL